VRRRAGTVARTVSVAFSVTSTSTSADTGDADAARI